LTVDLGTGEDRHVYIQAARGPQSGNLTINYTGGSQTYNLTSASSQLNWLDLGVLPDEATNLQIIPEGNGEVALIDLLVVPEDDLQEAQQKADAALDRYQDKVLFLYPMDQQALSDGWFTEISELGRGAADSLHFQVNKSTDDFGELTFPLGNEDSLISGPNYALTIELSTPFREVPCTLEIRSGKKIIESQTVLLTPGTPAVSSLEFQLPPNASQVSLTVRTGSDQIRVGTVTVIPTGSLPQTIDIEYPWDASGTLSVIRREVWNDTGAAVMLNENDLEVTENDGNMAAPVDLLAGHNTLSMNISQAYAVVIAPTGWSADPVTIRSSFDQISKTRYTIDPEIDGTAFIVLSESYHRLWHCSGQALSFKAFGVVNGYMISGEGLEHREVVFTGSEIYDGMFTNYLAASLIAMVMLVAYPFPMRLVKRLFSRSV
jgi:hypothetical protein